MYLTLSRFAGFVARLLAMAGGALLLAVVVLTVVSIIGRALFSAGICCGPIRGIYDYTEIAVGAAIFAFLPWCSNPDDALPRDRTSPAEPVRSR